MSFIGIHNHSDYSSIRLKDSIIKVKDMIDYAVELGHAGVALTDHEALCGTIKALSYVKKQKESGKIPTDFKMIIGNEIYLVDREAVDYGRENNERIDFYHLILLAKNRRGYQALVELSSKAWSESFHFKGLERVPTYKEDFFSMLSEYRNDIVCSTACLGGELAKLYKKYMSTNDIEDKKAIHRFIMTMKNFFGDNFYLEIQPSFMEEQIEYNKFVLKLSEGYGIKAIVTTDAHYLKKEYRVFHRNFLASKEGDREVDDFYSSTYMMSTDEIRDYLKDYISEDKIQELFNNTLEIGAKIEEYDLKEEVKIPLANIKPFKIKSSFYQYYDQYKYLKLYAESEHEIDRFFFSQIEDGFLKKKKPFNDIYLSRLNEELEVFWEISKNVKQQLSGYFVLTKEIIDEILWSCSYVGVSRGSCSGSLCCELLDIVDLDPIVHNLPFYRFMSIDRKNDFPDIDIDSQTSMRSEIIEKMKQKYGYDKVINMGTFKTEKAKSCVQTAMRGLGFDADAIQEVSKLATHPTLEDCLRGNKEEGLEPLKDFIAEIKKHEGLEEAILLFEGLIAGRSQHASGVLVWNDGITKHSPIMKTNSGLFVTQFDQSDCEYVSGMKIDLLSVSALDKIDTCVKLLQDAGKIEKDLSKKEIYDKYLHPDVLEWNNPEVYNLLYTGEVPDAFQFDTSQGKKAIAKIKPHSFADVLNGNTLMRLQTSGEQPMDKYVRFKNDISQWYDEMKEAGLNEEEIKVLEEHLLNCYGVANTQEDLMEMSMNPKIANFTLSEANKLRKTVAKAKAKDQLVVVKEMFYNKGMENGNRKELLEYVWEKQVMLQAKYGFSRNHVAGYSAILLQELNLVYRFGSIFWKTAILTEKIGDNGGVAVAVGNMKDTVINPDINLSKKGFAPLESKNKILYGLLSIDGIGESIVDNIIENRPYNSLDDIFTKLVDTKKISLLNLFTLAKSGALDSLCEGSRKELMVELVKRITLMKDKLTMTNVSKLYDKLPNHLLTEKKLYWFRNIYLKKAKKDKDNFYVSIDALDFINSNFSFVYDISESIIINIKEFEKYYKKNIKGIQDWIQTEEALNLHHKALCRENWNLYCTGDFASWEMDTIYFYTKEHELDTYNLESMFNIANFNELPETPVVDGVEKTKKGKEYVIHKTYTIAGTVVHKNKDKKLVYILTKDGVVPIKFYESNYKKYDKKIVEGEGKNKKVLSESYFKRGTKLVVTGYRKLDEFIPKVYNFNSSAVVKTFKENGKVQFEFEKMK